MFKDLGVWDNNKMVLSDLGVLLSLLAGVATGSALLVKGRARINGRAARTDSQAQSGEAGCPASHRGSPSPTRTLFWDIVHRLAGVPKAERIRDALRERAQDLTGSVAETDAGHSCPHRQSRSEVTVPASVREALYREPRSSRHLCDPEPADSAPPAGTTNPPGSWRGR
jgi:hypothetical protein